MKKKEKEDIKESISFFKSNKIYRMTQLKKWQGNLLSLMKRKLNNEDVDSEIKFNENIIKKLKSEIKHMDKIIYNVQNK